MTNSPKVDDTNKEPVSKCCGFPPKVNPEDSDYKPQLCSRCNKLFTPALVKEEKCCRKCYAEIINNCDTCPCHTPITEEVKFWLKIVGNVLEVREIKTDKLLSTWDGEKWIDVVSVEDSKKCEGCFSGHFMMCNKCTPDYCPECWRCNGSDDSMHKCKKHYYEPRPRTIYNSPLNQAPESKEPVKLEFTEGKIPFEGYFMKEPVAPESKEWAEFGYITTPTEIGDLDLDHDEQRKATENGDWVLSIRKKEADLFLANQISKARSEAQREVVEKIQKDLAKIYDDAITSELNQKRMPDEWSLREKILKYITNINSLTSSK